jgi:hypothetical protein
VFRWRRTRCPRDPVRSSPSGANRDYGQSVNADVVVALGAWCDLVPPEESAASPGGLSFDVHEFAMLADGRRLTLHTGRGFTSYARASYPAGNEPSDEPDPWSLMTRESVESGVRNVVLPDDDESHDEHPYGWLSELLRQQDVDVSVEQLRRVPYRIELSDRLERHLMAEHRAGEG